MAASKLECRLYFELKNITHFSSVKWVIYCLSGNKLYFNRNTLYQMGHMNLTYNWYTMQGYSSSPHDSTEWWGTSLKSRLGRVFLKDSLIWELRLKSTSSLKSSSDPYLIRFHWGAVETVDKFDDVYFNFQKLSDIQTIHHRNETWGRHY